MKSTPTSYKLQQQQQSVSTRSLSLHLVVFTWYCFGTYCDRNHYHLEKFDSYGGRFKYCTMITIYLNLIGYGLASVLDLVQLASPTLSNNNENKSKLVAVRDHIMSFWVANLSLFNTIMYWSVASVRLEGFHHKDQRKLIPVFGWYNQYLRTIPALTSLVCLSNVRYELSALWKTTVCIVLFSVWYTGWMVYLASVNGSYPYKFVERMNATQLGIFTLFGILLMFLIDQFIRKVVSKSWKNADTTEGAKLKES